MLKLNTRLFFPLCSSTASALAIFYAVYLGILPKADVSTVACDDIILAKDALLCPTVFRNDWMSMKGRALPLGTSTYGRSGTFELTLQRALSDGLTASSGGAAALET